MIADLAHDINGITFLGGEPTCQPAAVTELSRYAHSLGLNTLLFSGHTYKELIEAPNSLISTMLSEIDLLIDGPFVRELFDLSRPWVGSKNQNYCFLTNRLSEYKEALPLIKNAFEIVMTKDGRLLVNGMGNVDTLKDILYGKEYKADELESTKNEEIHC